MKRSCTSSIAGAWKRASESACVCEYEPLSTRSATASVISASRALRCLTVMSPAATTASSRTLMLTSWSEQFTPPALSIASVLIRPPMAANSIRPRCVQPRLPPSPTTRAAQLAAVHAHGVVGLVADVGVGLGRRLDVGADAAVPAAGRPARAGWPESARTGVSRSASTSSAARACAVELDRLRACAGRSRRPRRSARGRSRPSCERGSSNRRWRSAKRRSPGPGRGRGRCGGGRTRPRAGCAASAACRCRTRRRSCRRRRRR